VEFASAQGQAEGGAGRRAGSPGPSGCSSFTALKVGKTQQTTSFESMILQPWPAPNHVFARLNIVSWYTLSIVPRWVRWVSLHSTHRYCHCLALLFVISRLVTASTGHRLPNPREIHRHSRQRPNGDHCGKLVDIRPAETVFTQGVVSAITTRSAGAPGFKKPAPERESR